MTEKTPSELLTDVIDSEAFPSRSQIIVRGSSSDSLHGQNTLELHTGSAEINSQSNSSIIPTSDGSQQLMPVDPNGRLVSTKTLEQQSQVAGDDQKIEDDAHSSSSHTKQQVGTEKVQVISNIDERHTLSVQVDSSQNKPSADHLEPPHISQQIAQYTQTDYNMDEATLSAVRSILPSDDDNNDDDDDGEETESDNEGDDSGLTVTQKFQIQLQQKRH